MATSKKPTTNKTKSTQTNSYTPSKSVIKVIDSKTGKPYMYDKTYDAIFDTNGNQLDSDDFRHIKELTKVSPKKDHATVVAEKKKELREKGITSEYAAYYKPGDSEKALSIIDYSAGYLDYTMADKDLLDSDMAIENAKKLKVESQLNDEDRALKKGTILKGVDIPLLWSLGMPAKGRFPGMTTRGSWDISDYRPTRGSENFPYYFTPLGKTYNTLEEKENRNAIIDTTIMTALRDYRSDPVKYANTSMEMYDISNRLGNLGSYGMSLAPDSSYLSLHDKWDLDPNASGHMPKFAPDFVYSAGLTELGIPKKDHARMIKDFKAGKSVTEIAGFAPTVPVYDRIYQNSKGESIKEILEALQNAGIVTPISVHPKYNDRYNYENRMEKFAYGGKVKKYANGGKLPIDMYGRSVRKYEGGGRTPINIAPIESLPAGTIQNPAYQEYLAKINSDGIEKVAQSPGLLSTKSSSTTGDAVGAIGGIAGGFLSSAGTKQVEKGHMIGGTAMQAAGTVAPIATNPALLAATGGLSALAIPLAAGIGALAGIPKQNKYNRIEKGNNIEEQLAMYQGMDTQNNYMQDPIRYAAYGGKINHYGNGTPGITYDQEGGHISPVEIVGQKIHKAISANIFADLIEAMNAPKKGKTKSMEQTLRDVLYGYNNPTFTDKSKGYEPTFYGDNNYTMTNRWVPQQAAYGGQFPGGELAQVESGETFSHGGTLHSVKTKSKHKDLPENLANQFLPDNSTVYSSIPIKNIKDVLPIAKQFGLNTDLTAVKLYAGEVKNGTTVADLSKKGYKKLQPKKDLGNQFYTKADLRNTKYFEEGLTALGEVLNPETYRNIANNEYAQGQQGIQQILHAAYGGKVNQYAYGIGDPEDEPGYRSGSSSWAGAPGAGLRDAQYPPEMLNPPIVNIPTTVPPPTYTPQSSDGPYINSVPPMTPKAFTTYIEPRGLYDDAPIDIAPPDPWQNPPYAYPTTTTPEQEFEKHKQETGGGNYPGFSGYTYTGTGDSTARNGKSPYKLSPADMAALGVGAANGAASLLTLQQKMYDNEITDKSRLYNMKTELPDNFTNPTLGALRAGLQSSAQNNNWKNTSAMSSEMLSKTVTGLNSALLEQSRQNVGLFNAKQAAIYQALGVDTANKLAWNKDKTALGNYKLSAIGENLLKMASNGNTRAAENELAQMDDATLRAMLVTIGPNSKYLTEQIERIINSRKGVIQSDKRSV